MPEQKTVFFAENDPEKWFNTEEACLKYEKKVEIKAFINSQGVSIPAEMLTKLVNALINHYTMEPRNP